MHELAQHTIFDEHVAAGGQALAVARRETPGEPVLPEVLLDAGWPGERMRADAATKRLHTAIWTLRTMGLEGLLLTQGEGYLLDPRTDLRLDKPDPAL